MPTTSGRVEPEQVPHVEQVEDGVLHAVDLLDALGLAEARGRPGTITVERRRRAPRARGCVVSPPAECRYTSGGPSPPRNSWILPTGVSTRSSASVGHVRPTVGRRPEDRRALGELGAQLRHHLLGEQRHVLPGEVGGQAAELEQAEQVAGAEPPERFDELLGDGLGRADDRVAARRRSRPTSSTLSMNVPARLQDAARASAPTCSRAAGS